MGLSAAAAVSVLPVLLRPRSSPFSSPSSSSSAVAAASAVVRLFTKCGVSAGEPYILRTGGSSESSPVGEGNAALRRRLGSSKLWSARNFVPARSTFRAFATMSSEIESAANNPGLQETPDEATKGYFLQQTMYRIKDPKVSLDFYTRILGMSLLKKLDFPEAKFSLYFLGYEDIATAPTDSKERVAWTFGKRATLELTHNWGTESDENFKGHHNGNSEPRGYGHIGITVDDTYKACERFEKLGVKFVKKPDDGKMKGLAFIQDPDGYWVEIFDIVHMSSIPAKSS